MLFFDPRQFIGGDQVDRADALTAGDQSVEFLAFAVRAGDCVLFKTEFLAQKRRRALETLTRLARHVAAARFFVLCAGGERGAAFARHCQRLVGRGQTIVERAALALAVFQNALRFSQLFGQPRAHRIALFDFGDQGGGFGGDNRALFLDFLQPPTGLRHPLFRLA